MVYAPQRRHVVVQLSSTMQALALMQHLYTPNTMVLICRVVAHINIRAPAVLQPTRSFLALFFLVTITNSAAVLLHLVDFAGGQNGGPGLILDFVGQAHKASFTRIILLDIAIFLLQVTTLVVAYVANYGSTIPKSAHFAYEDLLLPPTAPSPVAESDLDVESGDQFAQRRHGKGPRYRSVPSEGSDLWNADEEEDDALLGGPPPGRVFSDISANRARRSTVPLIFNIPLTHLANLVFRLPAPMPPRLFSGGTPLHTPPVTPQNTETNVSSLISALAAAQARAAPTVDTNVQRLAETRSARSGEATPDPEQGTRTSGDSHDEGEERSGRIPGGYWTTRAGS